MMRKQFAYAVAIGALAAAPAFAQSANFVTQAQHDDWRASKLAGVNIYGQNNQKIGDVTDVIVGRDGSAKAVVIGVGGFLGIGEKNVAVPFSAVQWSSHPVPVAAPAADATAMKGGTDPGTMATGTAATVGSANNTTGTNMTAANNAPAGTMAMKANPAMTPGTGATLDGTAAPTVNGTSMAMNSAQANGPMDYPDHGMVNFNKTDLQNAPAFHYASEGK